MRRASTPPTSSPNSFSKGCSRCRSTTITAKSDFDTCCKGNARQMPVFQLLDVVWTMGTLHSLLIIIQVMLLHSTDPLAEGRCTQQHMSCPHSNQEHAGFWYPVNIDMARSLKCTCKMCTQAAEGHTSHLQYDGNCVNGQHAACRRPTRTHQIQDKNHCFVGLQR